LFVRPTFAIAYEISAAFKPIEGGCVVPSVESSSDKNSRLLKAVLNISSVRDDPLVFKGDPSRPSFFFILEALSSAGKRFLLHSFRTLPS
jgi:hypothetical protein